MVEVPRWLWVVLIVVAVIVIVGGVWTWRQRQILVEQAREAVEQERYEAGELGLPPGQPPVKR